jgi:hypothetical protein
VVAEAESDRGNLLDGRWASELPRNAEWLEKAVHSEALRLPRLFLNKKKQSIMFEPHSEVFGIRLFLNKKNSSFEE